MTSVIIEDLEKIKDLLCYCQDTLDRLSKKRIKINAQCNTNYGEDVYVCTDVEGWNVDKAIPLYWTEGGVWRGDISIEQLYNEYKLIIKNKYTGEVKWEEFQGNRSVSKVDISGDDINVNIQFNIK